MASYAHSLSFRHAGSDQEREEDAEVRAPGRRTLTEALPVGGAIQRKAGRVAGPATLPWSTGTGTGAAAVAATSGGADWINAAFRPDLYRAGAEAGAVQRRAGSAAESDPAQVQAAAQRGIGGSGGRLPYLELIQRSFGRHDVGGVQAHLGAEAGEGARAMGAVAFATGHHVAFAGAPDLHTAAHEAAHVVQQRAGVHLKGGVGEEGDEHERHADAVADRVVAGESAESLLDRYAAPGGAPGGASGSGDGPVQRRVYLGGKSEFESKLPDDVAATLTQTYGAAAVAELRERVRIAKPFKHADWEEAAEAAFHNSRRSVNPGTQPLLWYGKDSEQRNVAPNSGGPAATGQFRESQESRALAEKLLAKLAELAEASRRGKKETLGKGAEGQWKEAIMVGVMITVLGKRYAAKSGVMTEGFRQAAQSLGLHVVDRGDDRIVGFSPAEDRASDPVAQRVGSGKAEASATEVGQAPGKCALPKLISEVAASKNDAPESATEKLFSPDEAMDVIVKGVGGEVARHGDGCSVPSCITCRALTELQLEGAPARDSVLSQAEQGYVEKLDRQSKVNNQLQEEAEAAEKRRLRNRRKQKKDVDPDAAVLSQTREPTDRADTWPTIQARVEATRQKIVAVFEQAPTKTEEAKRKRAEGRQQKLGVWANASSVTGAKSDVGAETEIEELVAKALWADSVPVLKELCSELQRDYKVPAPAIPELGSFTIKGVEQHVDAGLAYIKDRARSSVARQYGKTV